MSHPQDTVKWDDLHPTSGMFSQVQGQDLSTTRHEKRHLALPWWHMRREPPGSITVHTCMMISAIQISLET